MSQVRAWWDGNAGDASGWYAEEWYGDMLLSHSQMVGWPVDLDGYTEDERDAVLSALSAEFDDVELS